MNESHDNKSIAILFMIASAFAFTTMQVFIKLATDIPVFEKVFFRNIIGLLFTLILIYRQRLPIFGKKENRKLLILRGSLGALGVVVYFYSVTFLPLADAAIINKTSPVFVTLFAWWFLKEKLPRIQIPALIFAFIGVLLVIKPQFSAEALPALAGLAGAMFAGGAYTVLRVLKGKEHPTTIVFFFCLFSSALMLPMMLVNFVMPNAIEWFYLISIGTLALIGQYSITFAYRFAPAAEVSIFNYTSVIFAVLLGYLIWQEIPDTLSIFGGIIIVGVALFVWLYGRSQSKLNETF